MNWFNELYRIIKAISYGGTSKKLTAQLIGALNHTLSTGGGSGEATQELTSTGDVNDASTFNADNSGIRQKDVNDVTMFTLWSDGTFGGNIFIVDKLPSALEFGGASDNVFIGTQISDSLTSGYSNVAIGNSALQSLVDGQSNVAVGQAAGYGITDGNSNTFLGHDAYPAEASASDLCLLGGGTSAAAGVTANAIAIGADTAVTNDNTAVIGNDSIEDVYFGSEDGAAILHGNGDAIVFPESDPHVAGAAYWQTGVLVKSAG